MKKIVAKYILGTQVKHAFHSYEAKRAICGVLSKWWKADKEGLDGKRCCKNCLKYFE